jgi:hypothetical protein
MFAVLCATEAILGMSFADEVFRALPRRRGERAVRVESLLLYRSSTLASRPLTRAFSASSSDVDVELVDTATSLDVLVGACFDGAGVVGSWFSFLGLRRGLVAVEVGSEVAVSLAAFGVVVGIFVAAFGVFGDFVLVSLSRSTPPADPALPCSVVVTFLDLAGFAADAGVGFGPGDEDFEAMMVLILLILAQSL